MKLGIRLLRFLMPHQESERRDFRLAAKESVAHADDLTMTLNAADARRFWQDVSNGQDSAMNDPQQTVIFSTFREICRFATSKEFAVRFCRHPKHEAANTGMATCNESQCPITHGKTA